MPKERNKNIDLLKGFLIILVIAGHLIGGTIRDSFPRYIIYSFHMPLFIGISGYLIRMDWLSTVSFGELLKKYTPRIILPWLLAIQIFFLLRHGGFDGSPIKMLQLYISDYLCPYYHLWFILGFLTWLFLTWLLLKNISAHRPRLLLLVAALISVAFCIFDLLPLTDSLKQLQYTVMHDFHLFYYIYFVLGMIVRKYQEQIFNYVNLKCCLLCFAIFMLTYILLFFLDFSVLEQLVKYALNLSLLLFLLGILPSQKLPSCKLLEFIGENSLAFYLYHMVGKLAASALCHRFYTLFYPVIVILCTLVAVAIIALLTKNKWINRHVFGIKESCFSKQ